MKKILLSIIIIILGVLSYLVIFNGIKIGSFKIDSISSLKNQSELLDKSLDQATMLTAQTYAETKGTLDTSISNLKTTKQKYEDKITNLSDEDILKYKQINNYDKEFLWTEIGTCATNHSVDLDLDILSTSSESYYNLSFTIVGTYSDVTNFIYSLENDDELGFKIENFSMQPYSVTVSSYYKDENGKTLYTNTENPYGATKSTTYSESNSSSSASDDNNSTNNNTNTNTTTQQSTTNTNSGNSTTMVTANRVQVTFVVNNVNVNLD